ncbi:cell division protein FtsI, partial [Brevibacterium paucivorans]
MKKSLGHVFIVGLVMFALLFGSVSTVQFLAADSLRTNPMNNRTLLEQLSRPRGPILIDGEPVAKSVPVDTQYKYQRQYG